MYLHQHKSFKDLLLAESEERAIDPIDQKRLLDYALPLRTSKIRLSV